jgi:hypothetical protein
MSLITKRLLSDQILIRLNSGFVDVSSPVQKEDVWLAIEQKVNSMFKMQHFSMTLPSGETIPENLSLAEYENVAITNGDGLSCSITLPVMPISLPRNMGVQAVIPNGLLPCIPLMAGQRNLLRTDQLLNDLMGEIGYELIGKKIKLTKDLTPFEITTATLQLVVLDISLYSEDDMLPIPADYEQQIIDDLIKQFSPIQPQPSIVSNYPEPTKT